MDTWISDQLYALLGAARTWRCRRALHLQARSRSALAPGLSEDAVVNFVKALGRKATSAAALAGQLQGQARPGAPGAAGRAACCAVAARSGLPEAPPGLAQDRAAALVLGART